MLVPTRATKGAPRPKTSGTSRNSSLPPVPYPAIALGPPAAPTSAVVRATVIIVCDVVTEATAPTRKMSANIRHCRRAHRNCATLRLDNTYQPRIAADNPVVEITANPAPVMPSAGIGPNPKIKHGDNGTSRATPAQ